MFTKLKNKFGFIRLIITKQVGDEIQIMHDNDPMSIGFLKNVNEKDYHIKLRRDYLKDDGILLDGDRIDNYKGRYKINKFQK